MREDLSRPDPTFQGSHELSLSKIGEKLLLLFTAALKTTQIYEANNLTLVQQLNVLHGCIEKIIETEGEAQLQFRRGTLFFNTARIRFDFSSFQHFKFLATELLKKQIGVINFDPALTKAQLQTFLILMSQSRGTSKQPFEDFQKLIRQEGVNLINLEKILPFDIQTEQDEEGNRQEAKKVFFKSISYLKDIFDRSQGDKRIRMKTTRRLMQTLVNVIINNESFMLGLTNMKNYDEYTLNHSVNVCVLALCLGRRLELGRKELIELGIAAFFHDIGKMEIPAEILNKPGKLTPDERSVIEKHPFLGAQRLLHIKELNYLPIKALYVALEHHLKADLSGYPGYWKKDSIDLFSRIVEICDFFDAVTTKRPYRQKVYTRAQALQMLLDKSGEEFDPILLKVFAQMIGIYPIGTLVLLNTNEIGIVVKPNSNMNHMLRPRVKLIADPLGNKINGEIVDLTERVFGTSTFKRNILQTLDPAKYGIVVSDYFIVDDVTGTGSGSYPAS